MAFYPNAGYGYIPGAPQATHRWAGNQFVLSDMPPLPPPPPPPVVTLPPPPPPITPADVVNRAVNPAGTQPGGAEPGGGAYGTGGIGTSPYPGQPNPGMGGGVGAPGGDQTFSGYPGVYAQSPGELDSRFGQVGGMAGMLGGSIGGIPGVGTVAGALGGAIDAARYNGINAQYGVPGTVNPWGSAASAALAGIGIPFTNWNLAELFDVPSARARHLGLLDDYGVPLDRESIGYGALAANAPHTPGAPFGNTGWAAGMDPTRGSYPAGFLDSSLQPSHGLPTEQAAQLNLDVGRMIAANPEVFGILGAVAKDAGIDASGKAGVDIATGKGSDPGVDTSGKGGLPSGGLDVSGSSGYGDGKGGSDSTGGDSGKGGGDKGADVSGSSGLADGSGYKFRGGLIGAPPGRFAAGGTVRAAGRMPTSQPLVWPENQPRQQWSDIPTPGGAGYGRRQYDDPAISPRERAINEAMDDYIRGQLRLGYPEAFARGGTVGAPDANITPAQFGLLRGIDPPGPDDQIGALQSGEGVIRKSSMSRYPGLLAAVNSGRLDPKKLEGLLAPPRKGKARLR